VAGWVDIDVSLLEGDRIGTTRIRAIGMELGEGEEGFRAFEGLVRQLVRGTPVVSGEINTAPHVTHREVVRTMEIFSAAGVSDITFVGAPPPRR